MTDRNSFCYIMKYLFAALLSFITFPSLAETGVFIRDLSPKVSIENPEEELVLRYSMRRTSVGRAKRIILADNETPSELVQLPEGRGVLLAESKSKVKRGFIIYILF